MNYIIIDLEWNQSNPENEIHKRDLKLRGEIIQIGAVKVNSECEIVGTYNKFIKPIVYSKMNPYVEKLINVSDNDLQYCDYFPEVYRDFLAWCGTDYVLLSWGNDDRFILKDNLRIHSYESEPFDFLDLQKLYGIQVGESNRQVSLNDALESVGIHNQLMRHDALGDAMNAMFVANAMDLLVTVDKMPKNAKYLHMKRTGTEQLIRELCAPDFILSSVRTTLDRTELFITAENALICPVCSGEVTHASCKGHTKNSQVTYVECNEHGRFYTLLEMNSFKAYNFVSTKYYYYSEALRKYYDRPTALPDLNSHTKRKNKGSYHQYNAKVENRPLANLLERQL